MATRVDTFYPSTTDQDFTAPSEADIRKLVESVGGSDNTTVADFGTGTAEIILDPYNARGTTGTTRADDFGWAINRDGTDGMAVPDPPTGIDTAERFIEAGTWTFNARFGAGLALTGTYRLRVRVYKVDSSGNRSLLFGPVNSTGVSPTAAGVDVSATSSESEHTFSQDETLLVSYGIEKTTSTVANESVEFRLNDTLGNDCEIILPSGIRTRYAETITLSAVGTASRTSLPGLTRSVDGVGTASMARTVTAGKTVTVNGVGTASRAMLVQPATVTVNGVGTVSGTIRLPLDEIPDDGDFSGSDPTATIDGTVYDNLGGPVAGATVLLFRQSDNLFIGSTITDAAGAYSFTRDTQDPNVYYVVAYSAATSHGTSDRDLAPD